MPEARKRRHHQRSRHGCVSCKQRHMRCDEGRPFCRNCLRNGAACGYHGASPSTIIEPPADVSFRLPCVFLTGPSDSHASTSPIDRSDLVPPQSLGQQVLRSGCAEISPQLHNSNLVQRPLSPSNILSACRDDPFHTLALGSLSRESKMILDHFAAGNNILTEKTLRRPRDPEMFRYATSDVAFMHGMLLVAATSLVRYGIQRSLVEPTLYFHKLETIRLVNERLGDKQQAMLDGTLGAITCLVIFEARNTATNTAAVHMKGLKQLVEMREDLHTRTFNCYLHRLIMLADLLTLENTEANPLFEDDLAPDAKEMPLILKVLSSSKDHLAYFEQELGLDSQVSKIFVVLHQISNTIEETDKCSPEAAKNILVRAIVEAERAVDTLVRRAQYELRTVKGVQSNSGCCVLAQYLYVYYFLRRIPGTSSLYDYMIRLLKEDMERVAENIRNVYPKEVLFWVFSVGALAALGRPEEEWFKKELSVTRRELRIKTWEVAKFILKKFAWVENWNEETSDMLFSALDV